MNKKDVLIDGSNYEISLFKLIGKKIKDITGSITKEFGDPTFKMYKVVFEDDTFMVCEGEHDLPYLTEWGEQPNFDEETLEAIYSEDKEENEEE